MKDIAYTWIISISKAKHLHFVSNFFFFLLRTAFTIALLICLACSKSKLSWIFLNVIQQILWRDLIFDNSKNGDVCGIPIKFCQSFGISLFKTSTCTKWLKIHKICRNMHPFALWLFVNCFVSSCHPLALVLTLPKNKKKEKNKWTNPLSPTQPLCAKWMLFSTHFPFVL